MLKVNDYLRHIRNGKFAKVIKITNKRGNPWKAVISIIDPRSYNPCNEIIAIKIANRMWEYCTPAYMILYADKNSLTGEKKLDNYIHNPCAEIFGKCDWHPTCYNSNTGDSG